MDNETKIELGTRFYIPQRGERDSQPSELHAATLIDEPVLSTTWGYECECGYRERISTRVLRDWIERYGTPPPPPEPLPALGYTEESLISELASYPINEGECFMHGPDCVLAEFDCEPRKGSLQFTDAAILRQMVEKARELVKRRPS